MTCACERCGQEPTYKAREMLQEPYRGMWQAHIAWEREAHQRDMPIYPGDLRRELNRIADEKPDAVPAIAVRTTEYGGEPRHG